MEQTEANRIGFREVDQDGQPFDPETAGRSQDMAGSSGGEPNRLRPNPFIIVLWVLALGLTIGSVWVQLNAFSYSGPMPGSGGPPLGFLLMNFAPQAALAGTLSIICLLFWHAMRWQRARQ